PQPAFKLFPLNEMIGLAVDFEPAGPPGRIGDGKRQLGDLIHQTRHESGFSGARRSRDDEYRRHSMLRDCSRIRSISALAANPRSVRVRPVSPSPPVLERIVFVSRFISCSRKSSFFPVSPSALSSASV